MERIFASLALAAGDSLVAIGTTDCAAGEPVAPAAKTYFGQQVHIGNGSARTVVLADRTKRPVAIGVELTEGMLTGLPPQPNPADHLLDWHYYLQFRKGAPATGFDHVLIDWHPKGHVPPGIYDVAHFDLHFYVIDQQSQLAIRYLHDEVPDMTGVTMPAKELVPVGYSIPPGTQVSRMGLHAIPNAAPEFHGGKFSNTLIYGYDGKGALAFIEPMLALDYLKTQPSVVADVAVPANYSYGGMYPARYSVIFDPARRTYRVMLDRLTPWQVPPTPPASR